MEQLFRQVFFFSNQINDKNIPLTLPIHWTLRNIWIVLWNFDHICRVYLERSSRPYLLFVFLVLFFSSFAVFISKQRVLHSARNRCVMKMKKWARRLCWRNGVKSIAQVSPHTHTHIRHASHTLPANNSTHPKIHRILFAQEQTTCIVALLICWAFSISYIKPTQNLLFYHWFLLECDQFVAALLVLNRPNAHLSNLVRCIL